MWTLPLDVIGSIITCADLGVINSLARSCTTLAAWVRAVAIDLADARTKSDGNAFRLPNGVLHGLACPNIDSGSLSIEFALGIATFWSHDDEGVSWGHNGFHHWVDCDNATTISTECNVSMHFNNGDYLIAWMSGVIIHCKVLAVPVRTSQWSWPSSAVEYTLPWHMPVRGFLVDGRIVPDVVGPWIDRIIAKITSDTGVSLVVDPVKLEIRGVASIRDIVERVDVLTFEES